MTSTRAAAPSARRRILLTLLVGCLTAGAGASTAATAATHRCAPLIADPVGDASEHFLPTHAYHPELDLTKIDVGRRGSALSVLMRVVSLPAQPITPALYQVAFYIGTDGYAVDAYRSVDGTQFTLTGPATTDPSGTVTTPVAIAGSFDVSSGTVRVLVPVTLLGSPKLGTPLYSLSSSTSSVVGISAAYVGSVVDSTLSKNYRFGSPPCLA